jgi:hypothetical protein
MDRSIPMWSALLMTMTLAGTVSIANAAPAADQDPIAWVRRDKIRMGWTPERFDQYQMMVDAGMNAVMPRLELDVTVDYDPAKFEEPLSKNDAQIMKDLRHGSHLAKQVGLRYFHCLNLAAESQTYEIGFKDNPARYDDGILPSPVDPVYWKRTILDRTDRALRLLNDADEYAVDGVIIDPEMYALGGGGLPGNPDYGAYAFDTFLQETGKAAPADVKDVAARQKWIKDQGLQKAYEQWQFDRVRDFGRQFRDLVHHYRPNAVVGYIIYEDKMWFNAMAAGMTSKKIPVFIGPETTYSGVMDQNMVKYLAGIQKAVGVPCLLTPGVDMGIKSGQIPREMLNVLPGNIYQRCQYSAGYWVYAIYNFGNTAEQQGAFFGALKIVNNALNEQARTGKVVASLKAAPLPVATPPGFKSLLKEAAKWQPLPANTPHPTLPFEAAKLRGPCTALLWPKAGQEQSITIRSIKFGAYLDSCTVNLFNADGSPIIENVIPMNGTGVFRMPDAAGSFCAELMTAGWNGYAIEEVNCPMMLAPQLPDASGAKPPHMLGLNAQKASAGRFYFYVPAGKKTITMRLLGRPGEREDYTLIGPSGRAAHVWKSPKQLQTDMIPVTQSGIWCMQVDYLLNDGGFELMDLPNYFALRPQDVRVPSSEK